MTWLLEEPLPIIVLGVLVEIFLVVAFFLTGKRSVLLGMLGVAVLAGMGLMLERAVVTDREQIEVWFDKGITALEARDTPTLLGMIDPQAAQVRSDVQRALGMVKFKNVAITDLVIVVHSTEPVTATADVTVKFSVNDPKIPYEHGLQKARLGMKKVGEKWLVTRIEAKNFNDRKN